MAESVLGVVAGFALWLGVSGAWALLAGATSETKSAAVFGDETLGAMGATRARHVTARRDVDPPRYLTYRKATLSP